MKLDGIDLKILAAVQRDGRITKLKLAEMVGLSPTPCWLRLRKLEQTGIILGYHARLSPRRIAPFATVLVEVVLANHRQIDFERFEQAIAGLDEVTDCWSVGGSLDYVLKIVVRDIDTYQRLIDRMLAAQIGIARYFTYIVTKTVKEDAPLPAALFSAV
jgi:Lrp/AsnC family transcriptional regulator, regulator of ectoine-degradation genes